MDRDLYISVKSKLPEIKECLVKFISDDGTRKKSCGLMGEWPGALLFLYHYARVMDDPEAETAAQACAWHIVDSLPEMSSMSYCDGWAGLILCLEYLRQEGFIDIDAGEIISDVAKGMSDYTEYCLRNNIYEFLYGAGGTGFFWLAMNNKEMVSHIVSALYGAKEDDTSSGGYKWRMRSVSMSEEPKYNLSMSHGIVGVLLFLLRAFGKYDDMAAKEMVEGGIEYILSLKGDGKDEISLFPSIAESGAPVSRRESRLGWCYGDLGTAYFVHEAAVILHRSDWTNEALSVYRHASRRRTVQSSMAVDAGLCHGTAGIAMMFNDIYGKTGDAAFRECTDFWIGETLGHARFPDGLAGYKTLHVNEWYNDCSMLTGISGIGLSLLSLLSGDTGWYRLLLP